MTRIFSDENRYYLVFLFCLISSACGILTAIFWTKNELDGGRGGAVAVAAALLTLFLNRGYAFRILEARLEKTDEALERLQHLHLIGDEPVPDIKIPEMRRPILDFLKTFNREQTSQNRYLAVSTAIGTLVWGFGDIVARWGINYFFGPPGPRWV